MLRKKRTSKRHRRDSSSDSSDCDYDPLPSAKRKPKLASRGVGQSKKRSAQAGKKEAVAKRKTQRRRAADHSSTLPNELLLEIFLHAVKADGTIPLLPRKISINLHFAIPFDADHLIQPNSDFTYPAQYEH